MARALQIRGHPYYYITDDGLVYSRNPINNKGNRIRKISPWVLRHGYLAIRLYGKNRAGATIHRLVAEAFIPNPEHKPEVNHKNGIRSDNRVENLEWVTDCENKRHSYVVLGRKGPEAGKFGAKSRFSKTVLQIKNDTIVGEYCGISEAARQLGLQRTCISQCCRGIKKTSGGFRWKYK